MHRPTQSGRVSEGWTMQNTTGQSCNNHWAHQSPPNDERPVRSDATQLRILEDRRDRGQTEAAPRENEEMDDEEDDVVDLFSVFLNEDITNNERWDLFEDVSHDDATVPLVQGLLSDGDLWASDTDYESNRPSDDTKLKFDDENAEYVNSSDSDLDWENQPFDYAVPLAHLLVQEELPPKTPQARAARLLRMAGRINLRSAREAGWSMVTGAQALRERVVETCSDAAEHMDGVVQTGRQVANAAGRVGEIVMEEVSRLRRRPPSD